MKRITSLAICLILLLAMAVPVCALDQVCVSVSTYSNTVYPGETIDFAVNIDQVEDCRSGGFVVSYDKSVFEFVSGRCLVDGVFMADFSDGTGVFAFTGGQTVSGSIFTFTLRVKSSAMTGGTYVSGIPSVRTGDGELSVSVDYAYVAIACNHEFGAWTDTNADCHSKSCSVCGTTESSFHTWDSGVITKEPGCAAAGEKCYTCADCGAMKAEPIAQTEDHTYGGWVPADQNAHSHFCTVCGTAETGAHNWDAGAVNKAPTCAAAGEMVYTCTACSETKTEAISQTDDHSYGNWVLVDQIAHNRTCTLCGKAESVAHNWNSGVIAKPANCVEPGEMKHTCVDCGAESVETVSQNEVHRYGAWNTNESGGHTATCSDCGKEISEDHSWDSGKVTKQASCAATGEMTYHCTVCDTVKTVAVEKSNDHSYDHSCDTECNICGTTRNSEHRYEDNWDFNGDEHWHICGICGEKKDIEGHSPGETATENKPQTCTVCGYVLEAALGHQHSYGDVWVSDETSHWKTCEGCGMSDSTAQHIFDNSCAANCSVCGYERSVAHEYGETWASDETGHWTTCQLCGMEGESVEHTPGAEATEDTPQACKDCGYELHPVLEHVHHFGDTWRKDEVSHWHECVCLEREDEAAHTWDEGVAGDETVTFSCFECDAQRTEPIEEVPFPWGMVLITSVGVVAGLAVVVVLLRKRILKSR